MKEEKTKEEIKPDKESKISSHQIAPLAGQENTELVRENGEE